MADQTTRHDPNCLRCHGTGSYEMERDCHRSAGIVPCFCKAPLPQTTTTFHGQPLVCWVCGYSAADRRDEMQPGECRIAAEWGRPPERCPMNGAEEKARGK